MLTKPPVKTDAALYHLAQDLVRSIVLEHECYCATNKRYEIIYMKLETCDFSVKWIEEMKEQRFKD